MKTRSPLALPDGFKLANQYELGHVLGQGGFGITYEARDIPNNRKVAIKEYYPLDIAVRGKDGTSVVSQPDFQELYDYGMGRFMDEAHALVRFKRHPGIVAVYDLFYENNTVYMAMQFLDGKTLKELLDEKGGKMPFADALSILIPVLDSLMMVHEVGMLHRDISPDNLFILPNRQVKLIDFGAARYAMREQNQVYSIIFKPGYTPEEQYRNSGQIGPWTDIYALAATFYHAITGKKPRDAMNRLEKDTLPLPSHMGVPIPPKMETALMKALAVKSAGRFQSAGEFKSAIVDAMKDEDILIGKTVPVWIWFVSTAAFIDLIIIILLFFS